MQQIISGKAYVLGDNVDTDQIIPAQYLKFDPGRPEDPEDAIQQDGRSFRIKLTARF